MTHAANKNVRDGEHLLDSAVAVKDSVADLATEAGHYARNRAVDARDSAVAMIDGVKSTAGQYNDTVVGFVRKNPYKSLAIATGVGLAAGFLLRRR